MTDSLVLPAEVFETFAALLKETTVETYIAECYL